MARAIWSGSISFGLVNVPVKAYTAARDHEVHFHQLEEGSGARIRYKKVSDKTGKEVDADHIELGYELSKGRYVTVDPDELEELRPRSTRTVDISDFVDLDEIDPIYYQSTYWLAPADDAAERPYRLLLAAMEDRNRVGIGSVVMRRKQYLAAIRPLDGALALSTMRFADEIVDRSQIDDIPSSRSKPEAKELRLATSIVDALATDWKPERYHDTYTDELKDLLARKAKGEEIVAEEDAPSGDAEVIDLMAALERSVEAARKGGRSRTGGRSSGSSGSSRSSAAKPAKKAAKKKAASKKATAKKAGARKAGTKKAAAKRRSA